jgi:hypothetical protein
MTHDPGTPGVNTGQRCSDSRPQQWVREFTVRIFWCCRDKTGSGLVPGGGAREIIFRGVVP